MASILIRTIIIYILLTFSLRIMGKRQIGELDVGDLVSTLLVSEIAAIPIDDPDIPLLNAVLPILFILSLEVIVSTIKNKSERLKSMLDGGSTFIIYKGRLLQGALRETRISVNELMAAARSAGVGDISRIEYAILEQNGTISVLEKQKSNMAHPIVIDGAISEKSRKATVDRVLTECGLELSEVFLMTVDDNSNIKIIKKEKEE